jgi:hypothetical protein
LKSDTGGWIHERSSKADLLAETFSSKNLLPEPVINTYTDLQANPCRQIVIGQLTREVVHKTLQALDESSGTGPDLLPARMLKNCAEELAYPILMLTQMILSSGQWPACWREHWIAPIFKRKAVFLPTNYRGVHLTAQLSKVVERLLLTLMTPHVQLWNLAGENQFAYTKKRGARDVLALLALRWVDALDRGLKVALYGKKRQTDEKTSGEGDPPKVGRTHSILAGAENSISHCEWGKVKTLPN